MSTTFRFPLPPACWLYAKRIISGKWKAECYGNCVCSFTRTHFIAKSTSPKKLRECARIFFWYNIMEPSMTHPDKKNSFFLSTFTKQVWSEEEIASILYICTQIGTADSWPILHTPVGQKPNLSTKVGFYPQNPFVL
jgi:hypothetical protein